MNSAAGLFLFTGFLGSGKTTVLNGILRSLSGARVGVIVNEWGKIGVDAALLADPSGIGVVELGGGQIFCSCVSGSFIAAAVKMASLGLDYILVETSGLAKPSTLGDIVAEAERRGAGSLEYRGMICVVDATRFETLRRAAAVLDEQVLYSDLFIVSKSDLSGPAAVSSVRASVAGIKGLAGFAEPTIVASVRGSIDGSVLDRVSRGSLPFPDSRFRGWGASGRPGTTSIVPELPPESNRLFRFLREIGSDAYRAKGFIHLADRPGLFYVDCAGESVTVSPADDAVRGKPEDGLVLIWKGTAPPASAVSDAWERIAGTAARIA